MPLTIKTASMKYKDANGNYVGIDAIAETTTSTQVALITAAGETQAAALQELAEDIGDSWPDDYSQLTQDVDDLKGAVNDLDGGTTGQVLRKRSNSDYAFEWASVGQPTDEQTANAVSAWLDDHPEATTTVQDGSLTEAKFSDTLKLLAIKDYITPQMYDAKGDGTTDDTTAMQNAINAATSSHKLLFLPIGVYKVTEALTLGGDLTMAGTNNFKLFGSASTYSTITTTASSLFSSSTARNVNINGVVFIGTSVLFDTPLETSLIENCTARGFYTIFNKNISVLHVHDNSFLSIKGYFTYGNVTDSFFANNYINGDNGSNATCFYVSNFTSTRIIGNYIDYFKYGFLGGGSYYFQDCIISDNNFDIIWRVFCARIEYATISHNVFTNISSDWFVNDSTQTNKMYNADTEMLTYRPCAIYGYSKDAYQSSSAGLYVEDVIINRAGDIFNHVSITGNVFKVATALYLVTTVNDLQIRDNSYAYPKFLGLVDNGGDSSHFTNTWESGNGVILWLALSTTNLYTKQPSYVDILHQMDITNIPRMLTSSGTKISTVLYNFRNVLKGSEYVFNGVVYRAVYDWPEDATGAQKNTCKWYDYAGNQQT